MARLANTTWNESRIRSLCSTLRAALPSRVIFIDRNARPAKLLDRDAHSLLENVHASGSVHEKVSVAWQSVVSCAPLRALVRKARSSADGHLNIVGMVTWTAPADPVQSTLSGELVHTLRVRTLRQVCPSNAQYAGSGHYLVFSRRRRAPPYDGAHKRAA